jgi:putative CRISPR-associated protein (TIGR02620 family)
MSEAIIITRHQGLVNWLNRNGVQAPVLPRAKRIDVEDKVVYGILPIQLASFAKKIFIVELPHLPKVAPNTELSADELDQYGARLVEYDVHRHPPYLQPNS